jgi:hypothetical protein
MTRFDELQQSRAMLIRLLDDGKPLPPVEGVDDLSPDDTSRLLVTCSTEVILHINNRADRRIRSRQGACDLAGVVSGRSATA